MRFTSVPCVVFCLLLSALCADAAPPAPGRYVGVLTLTKHVSRKSLAVSPRAEELVVTKTVKAVASVTAEGELTVVLEPPFSPVPGNDQEDVLRTTLTAGNTFTIKVPFKYVVTPPPSGETSSLPVEFYVEHTYSGRVQVEGNGFRLNYQNVPELNIVGQIDPGYNMPSRTINFTEFNYKFRRVGQ